MFISLLCFQVKTHCVGIRLTTLVTAVSIASWVVSQWCSRGYKRWARVQFEKHTIAEDMALSWCSRLESSRPPDTSRFSPTKDARRVLASDKDSLCCLTLQPHCSPWSILDIIPLQILRGKVLCGHVVLGYTMFLGFPRWRFLWNSASDNETNPCLNIFRENEKFLSKMQEENLRGAYYNLVFGTFLPEYNYLLFLD